ncbi:ParB/Sulfiredoxin [Tricharina praecox]|uniref:ParB/Sulfiredoxin n=1 Tax=Tricharina praecox TaxID=43433 RepID=UPI0022201D19|nr:ParB/Sulfiredoxin [Tricharina praecox]KAI5856923.1 ParB/Sulfiredoxin [Tricharina praecox]
MLGGSLQSRALKTQSLPLSSLLRPIPPVLDSKKIDSMVQTLRNETPDYIPSPAPEAITPGELPPVDVLHYRAPSGKDFYFAFGGCHRLQAYEKAQVESVGCKVLKVTRPMLKVYLGGSVDAIVGDE